MWVRNAPKSRFLINFFKPTVLSIQHQIFQSGAIFFREQVCTSLTASRKRVSRNFTAHVYTAIAALYRNPGCLNLALPVVL